MASPFARVIAQLMVTGASIMSRAFVAAYQQAVHNAGKGVQDTAKQMVRSSKMSTEEALQILNLTKADIKPDRISAQATQFFKANDPATGGSFYLQSKVFRAKESLEELIVLREKQAEEKRAQEAAARVPPKAGPPPPPRQEK
ncbi:unnamed protein product [Phaeothamnion confervicola]